MIGHDGRRGERGPGQDPGRLAAAALLVLLLLAAFPGLFSGKIFYLRDASQNHDPARRLVTERLREGELPLWDPYHGAGTPLLANPNQLVLHPITLLFLALPHDLAFTLSIVLQFGLLALGGYLLARRLPVSPPSALLAAAIFAFSGPAASLASMQNVLCAFAWLPLALWGWLGVVRGGGAGPLATAVLSLAVILATGEPATLLAFLALAVALAATEPRPEGNAPASRVKAISGVVALAALVAGAAIVPAMTLLPLTPRGKGLPAGEVFRWPLLPERLPELLLPQLFGDPTRLPPRGWWGAWVFEGGYPFLFCVFLGAIPLLCAAAALGAGPLRRRAAACATVGGGALVLAILPGLPAAAALLLEIPGSRILRYPERLLLVVTAAAALCAALGWERLRQRRGATRLASAAATLCVVTLASAVVLSASPGKGLDPALVRLMRLPEGYAAGQGMGSVRGGAAHALLWTSIECAALAAGLLLLRRGGARGAAATWVLPAIAGISLLLAAAPARGMAPRATLEVPSPLKDAVDRGRGGLRLHHGPRPQGLAVRGETDEQIWGYRFDRFTYALQTGLPDEVPTVLDAATDRMDLAPGAALAARLPGLPAADQIRILRVAAAGSVLAYEPLDDPGLVEGPALTGASRPEARLYKVKAPLPRVRFLSRQRPPRDPEDAIASLLDPDFDPDNEVLIEGTAAPRVVSDTPVHAATKSGGPDPAEAPTAVEVLQDDPERVTIRLVAPRAGHLVIADSDAPGWTALLDGVPAPLRRANMLFRAVPVPAGRHTVEMRYRPWSFRAGALTSLLGFVALVTLCARRRGR